MPLVESCLALPNFFYVVEKNRLKGHANDDTTIPYCSNGERHSHLDMSFMCLIVLIGLYLQKNLLSGRKI